MFPGSAFSNGASQVPWNGAGCEAVPLLDHVHIRVCVCIHMHTCMLRLFPEYLVYICLKALSEYDVRWS